MRVIRVIIADDHDMVREGLRRILERYDDIRVVGEADTGRDALSECRRTDADVLLLDLDMPDTGGLDVITQLKALEHNIKVLVLSMHDNDGYVKQAFMDGAKGYILKGAAPGELPDAIRKVAAGELFIDKDIAQKAALKQFNSIEYGPFDCLSRRELQVLSGIARNMKLKDIAEETNLSVSTISSYKQRLREKLDCFKDSDLTRLAKDSGIV